MASTVRFGSDGIFEERITMNPTHTGAKIAINASQLGTYELRGDLIVRQTTELTASGKAFKESDGPYQTVLRWISDDRIQLTYPSGTQDTLVRQKQRGSN